MRMRKGWVGYRAQQILGVNHLSVHFLFGFNRIGPLQAVRS